MTQSGERCSNVVEPRVDFEVLDDSVSINESRRDDRAAIDKAFSLLVAFGDQARTGLGVSELARRANLSKSTAFRVLGMLERNAMVERIGKNYRLGPRLHELGMAVYAPRQDRIRDQLIPFLTELFELTKQTVCLATLHGADVVCLATLRSHRSAPAPSRIGGRLPAHCTAVGKVLLAYDAEAVEAALATPLVELAGQLARIRSEGVAVDGQENRLGLTCIAAPIMGRNGKPLAALSVSASSGSDVHALTLALRKVCAAASQAMPRHALV